MSKQEFLSRLKEELSGLPEDDIAERLDFYAEMIDERMDDGLSEEEAIADIGPIEKIVSETIAEIPLSRLIKEKMKPSRRLRTWEIVLLVLGFPVWFPLLLSAAAVLFSLFIVFWALVLFLWAVQVSFAVSSAGAVIVGIILLCQGNSQKALLTIAAGLILGGLSIPLFFGCKAATKCAWSLTKKTMLGIKSLFIGKEASK